MCTTHDRLIRLLSKTLNDVFDPTFCVYRVPVYFQILYLKITEQRQIFANSDRYTNEDVEIKRSKKVLHSSAWDGTGRYIKEGVLAVFGGRLYGQGAHLLIAYNGDRSPPVSLDMWDGRKAVGDIAVDFKT